MRKNLTGLLGAVLVLTLAFSSAAFAVNPTPIETAKGGTVTVQVSFDAEPTAAMFTDDNTGRSKASEPYAPSFTKLEAYTTGISGTLSAFVEAAQKASELENVKAATDSAIVSLLSTISAASHYSTNQAASD
ncbi:MAG: hypothetical protein II948_07230, partial [Synergistaceae bacterium]|nr:hypothetical protein [Synergistaceae bacterium]